MLMFCMILMTYRKSSLNSEGALMLYTDSLISCATPAFLKGRARFAPEHSHMAETT